jgi:hypothetical protein
MEDDEPLEVLVAEEPDVPEPDEPTVDEPEPEAPMVEEPDEPPPEPDALVPAEPDAGVSETPVACEPDEPEPLEPEPDDPTVEEVEGWVPTAAPVLGCIAEEPEVVEPEPVAAGRSVAPEAAGGLVVDWAKAGAAARAVATRQAAMWVFSIDVSRGMRIAPSRRAHRVNASLSGIVPPSSARLRLARRRAPPSRLRLAARGRRAR